MGIPSKSSEPNSKDSQAIIVEQLHTSMGKASLNNTSESSTQLDHAIAPSNATVSAAIGTQSVEIGVQTVEIGAQLAAFGVQSVAIGTQPASLGSQSTTTEEPIESPPESLSQFEETVSSTAKQFELANEEKSTDGLSSQFEMISSMEDRSEVDQTKELKQSGDSISAVQLEALKQSGDSTGAGQSEELKQSDSTGAGQSEELKKSDSTGADQPEALKQSEKSTSQSETPITTKHKHVLVDQKEELDLVDDESSDADRSDAPSVDQLKASNQVPNKSTSADEVPDDSQLDDKLADRSDELAEVTVVEQSEVLSSNEEKPADQQDTNRVEEKPADQHDENGVENKLVDQHDAPVSNSEKPADQSEDAVRSEDAPRSNVENISASVEQMEASNEAKNKRGLDQPKGANGSLSERSNQPPAHQSSGQSEQSEQRKPSRTQEFRDLKINKDLRLGLNKMDIRRMTQLQQELMPYLLDPSKGDVFLRAKPKQGKKTAYITAVLQNINAGSRKIQVLIVCPTVHLAKQTTSYARQIGREGKVKMRYITVDDSDTMNCQLIFCTVDTLPRFVRDDLEELKQVVLDELDELFTDEENCRRLDNFLVKLKPTCQLIGISSTLAENAPKKFIEYTNHLNRIELLQKEECFSNLLQFRVNLPSDEQSRIRALISVIKNHHIAKCLVYVADARTAQLVQRKLQVAGLQTYRVSSDMSIEERESSLHLFGSPPTKCNLVIEGNPLCGYHITRVSLVVNYDLSDQLNLYLYRIAPLYSDKPRFVVNFVPDERTAQMIEQLQEFYQIRMIELKLDQENAKAI